MWYGYNLFRLPEGDYTGETEDEIWEMIDVIEESALMDEGTWSYLIEADDGMWTVDVTRTESVENQVFDFNLTYADSEGEINTYEGTITQSLLDEEDMTEEGIIYFDSRYYCI
jgi:hypothetical protein